MRWRRSRFLWKRCFSSVRLGGQCQPFKSPLPSGHRQPWAAYWPCSPLLPCGRVRGLGRLKPTLLSPQTDTQPRPLAAVQPWAPRAPRAFPPQDLRLLLLPKCPPPPSNVPSRLPIRSRPTPSPHRPPVALSPQTFVPEVTRSAPSVRGSPSSRPKPPH